MGEPAHDTRLRDVDGVVWHVPNGEITRVGNKSQQWSRAVVDVPVACDADIGAATDVIREVAAPRSGTSPTFASIILYEPDVLGVESLAPDRRGDPRRRAAPCPRAVQVAACGRGKLRSTRASDRAATPPARSAPPSAVGSPPDGRDCSASSSSSCSRSCSIAVGLGLVAPAAPGDRRHVPARPPPRVDAERPRAAAPIADAEAPRSRRSEAEPRSRRGSRRLRDRLGKTRAAFAGARAGAGAIDDDTWDELEETVAARRRRHGDHRAHPRATCEARAARAKAADADALLGLLHAELVALLDDGDDRARCTSAAGEPNVWMFVGVNGVGQDDDDRQARAARDRRGPPRRARRRRHVPRRGGRTARRTGPTGSASSSSAARRAPTPARSSSTR